jgi:hypothetical protein
MKAQIIILSILIVAALCVGAIVIFSAKSGPAGLSDNNQRPQSPSTAQQEQSTPAGQPAINAPDQQTVAGQDNTAGTNQNGVPLVGSNSPENASGTVPTVQTVGFGATPTADRKPLANQCSDGTPVGVCSKTKPKLCFDSEVDLVDACHSCGCPEGLTCNDESQCQ